MPKPFVTAAQKIASTTVPQIAASSVVKNVLLTQGPQTTHSLYTLLHSSSSPTLPSRPPPPNFLLGSARLLNSKHYRPKLESEGQQHSKNGVWSMSYLKKSVLKQMEGRGDIYKVTRVKFDKVSKRAASTGNNEGGEVEEEVVASTSSSTSVVAPAGGKGKKGAAAKKEEDQHVWVEGISWRESLPELKSESNGRKDTFLELKARQKKEKIEDMDERERIGLKVVR